MKLWLRLLALFIELCCELYAKDCKERVIALMPSSDVSVDVFKQLKCKFPKYDFSLCSFYGSNLKSYSKKAKSQRRSDLLKALQKNNAIIWCVRGGYGGARFLGDLPLKNNSHNVIIGYSDITALLNYTAQLYGWKNIHGAVLRESIICGKINKNIQIVENYLNNGCVPKIKDIHPLNNRARKVVHMKCELVGGNLSIVQSSIGTFWQINAKGKILMLEDVGEAPYAVDRNLNHLRQADMLEGCKAIIFGSFIKCVGSEEEIKVVLQEFADSIDIPVFKTDKFGHGTYNIPFVFNTPYSLDKKSNDEFVLG